MRLTPVDVVGERSFRIRRVGFAWIDILQNLHRGYTRILRGCEGSGSHHSQTRNSGSNDDVIENCFKHGLSFFVRNKAFECAKNSEGVKNVPIEKILT